MTAVLGQYAFMHHVGIEPDAVYVCSVCVCVCEKERVGVCELAYVCRVVIRYVIIFQYSMW